MVLYTPLRLRITVIMHDLILRHSVIIWIRCSVILVYGGYLFFWICPNTAYLRSKRRESIILDRQFLELGSFHIFNFFFQVLNPLNSMVVLDSLESLLSQWPIWRTYLGEKLYLLSLWWSENPSDEIVRRLLFGPCCGFRSSTGEFLWMPW